MVVGNSGLLVNYETPEGACAVILLSRGHIIIMSFQRLTKSLPRVILSLPRLPKSFPRVAL